MLNIKDPKSRPSPSERPARLRHSGGGWGEAAFIFDLNGTLLRKINRNQYQISIADLAPGMYILVLKDGHENYFSHKIIRK